MIPKQKNQIWVDLANAFAAYGGLLTNIGIRSTLGKLWRAISLEIEEAYQSIHDAIQSRSPKDSTGDDLDAVVRDYFDSDKLRKQATIATITMRFTGKAGVDASASVVTKNGTTLRYKVVTGQIGIIGSGGSVDLEYQANEPGSNYRAEVGQIEGFAENPPEGVYSCTNTTKTSGGEDRETDEALRSRLFLSWDDKARGIPGAIEFRAQSVSGVRYAAFAANYPYVGKDTVIVADSYGAVSQGVLDAVKEAVLTVRGAGRSTDVSYARTAGIALTVSVRTETGQDIQSIQESYNAAAKQIINAQYGLGADVFPSDFNLRITGIKSYGSIFLLITLDPETMTGLFIDAVTLQAKQVLSSVLSFAYNASTGHLIIGSTNIYIGNSGNYTVTINAGGIADITFYVDASLLPVTDTRDSVEIKTITDSGITLKNYQLPVLKKITMTTI